MKPTLSPVVGVFVAIVLSLPAQAQVSFFQPPFFGCNEKIFVADFNGDGKPDILCSDSELSLGNGDGTFEKSTSLSGAPVAVADFNGDGKPDILELTTGTLLVLLGNGDGTFRSSIGSPSGATLSLIGVADLTGTGKSDVVGVSSNGTSLVIVVYLSKGDGTFAPGVSYSLPSPTPNGLSFGDFNGDHHTDVVVTTFGQEFVFLGNGDGTLQTPPKTSTGLSSAQPEAAVGDFDGDGRLDLAVTNFNCYAPCAAPTTTYILLGNGDGTFQAPTAAFPSNLGPLVAADVNADGRTDLITESDINVVQIYVSNGNGTFTNANSYFVPSLPSQGPIQFIGMAVADFNGDGKLDIASGNSILLGKGSGAFQGIPLVVLSNSPGGGGGVAGVFDKSRPADVAWVMNNTLDILSNDGTGQLSLSHSYALPQQGFQVATSDFNGDGNLDLFVMGNGNYTVLLGNGDGSFQSPVSYTDSTLIPGFNIIAADFNKDGKTDLLLSLGNVPVNSNGLAVMLGNGDGTFAAAVPYYDAGFNILSVGDFNGDGNLDIASGETYDLNGPNGTALLFGNGDGTFQTAVFPTNLTSFSAQFAADLNNDGKPDLVNYFPGAPVALGNGDGTFTLLFYSPDFGVYALADVDGDGRLDEIGVQAQSSAPQQLGVELGNGDGTFGPFIAIPLSGAPALIADMNGDGKPDVVFTAGNSFPSLAVLLNTTQVVKDFTVSAAPPTSQTISAGQTATFTLAFAETGSFTGTINLSCAVTPQVTAEPTCGLSSPSVQITGTGKQMVTVNVGTTAPMTTSVLPNVSFPPGTTQIAWTLMVLGAAWLLLRRFKRVAVLAAPVLALALGPCFSCGGSGSSSHNTSGTPSGKYTATVTAISGSLSHNMPLTVVVQ